jgi:hypothetical protein
MGKVYYDLGLLNEARVVECSATDLIGQYVGQTGPKVQKKFDEALGRVLFVDEAYRLAEGQFAKEAMDEIVDCLTKERYQNKILIILAGYDNDINRLMNQNPGLTSRFPETISFHHLPPRHCRDLLLQCLSMKKLDTTQLEASPTIDGKLLSLFGTLAQTNSWGNARDVQTLAKTIFARTIKAKTSNPTPVVSEDAVLDAINSMIKERSNRATALEPAPPRILQLPTQQQVETREPPRPEVSTTITTETTTEWGGEDDQPPEQQQTSSKPEMKRITRRDAGVSDEVWEQLQRDRETAERHHRELSFLRQKAAELEREARAQEEELKRQRDDAARREALRTLELIRVARDLVERERRKEEERLKRDLEAKAKLKRLGICPAGFEWIPQEGGYRCAGGTHYVTSAELGT